uniref:RING-type domain-containing protein n=1 Tax=Clastoptera arizonana TaxID=38151 RepID=A0A1B6EBK9_9HEMI
MTNLIEIHKKYPLMIPLRNFTVWNGVIVIKGEPITVSISVPNFPSLKGISIKFNTVHESISKHKLYKSTEELESLNLLQLFDFLHDDDDIKGGLITCDISAANVPSKMSNNTDFCHRFQQVLSELEEIGVENIHECNGDLSIIKFLVIDDREEEHFLGLSLLEEYPQIPPKIIDLDLPEIVVSQINQATTVKDMFMNFQSIISTLQSFWNTYDMLYQRTWIIDPEKPAKKNTYCRIVINDNISILVTLNPLDLTTCPDIKFLGSDSSVLPLRTTVEENLKEYGWDEELSLYSNLLVILGLDSFPQKQQHEIVTGALLQPGECCICFMLRLEDDLLPAKLCNNSKCSSYFHISCLSEWFQAIPTNEPSFNLISGDCPCCGEVCYYY